MSDIAVIKKYYAAFNKGDMKTFFSLLDEKVEHEVNQGEVEKGKQKFAEFMKGMNVHYQEQVKDLVVFKGSSPGRFAAEFTIKGVYLQTANGLPKAKKQKYTLPVGAFFEVKKGKIMRVTNYYNLKNWIEQV